MGHANLYLGVFFLFLDWLKLHEVFSGGFSQPLSWNNVFDTSVRVESCYCAVVRELQLWEYH